MLNLLFGVISFCSRSYNTRYRCVLISARTMHLDDRVCALSTKLVWELKRSSNSDLWCSEPVWKHFDRHCKSSTSTRQIFSPHCCISIRNNIYKPTLKLVLSRDLSASAVFETLCCKMTRTTWQGLGSGLVTVEMGEGGRGMGVGAAVSFASFGLVCIISRCCLLPFV